jgi:SAM-dependent methyltransferase
MLEHFYQSDQFEEDWFTYQTLYTRMVTEFTNGSVFVEVGCWKGRSAACMCVEIANSKKDIEFYCVDIWDGTDETDPALIGLYDKFLHNLKSVAPYFRPLKMPSVDAAVKFKDASLDFVFIDAGHEYDAVKQDIQAWYPKVKPGGILAGHDYYPYAPTWGDVYKVVNELFPNDHEWLGYENCFLKRKPADK